MLKYLILYYYQDDNCNRIRYGHQQIVAAMFVQDPTLFTGLSTTQSQKSECPPNDPPPCPEVLRITPPLRSQHLTLWRKDVQVDVWLTVAVRRFVYPIITHSSTDCDPWDTMGPPAPTHHTPPPDQNIHPMIAHHPPLYPEIEKWILGVERLSQDQV